LQARRLGAWRAAAVRRSRVVDHRTPAGRIAAFDGRVRSSAITHDLHRPSSRWPCGRCSAGERRTATEALAAGIERAARLVEQLRALACSAPGAPTVAMQRPDLSELVREALADTVPLAIALRVLVRNLADNAVRCAPHGARVERRVSQPDGVPKLQVDDRGPGIPADERERVFDRFYRGSAGDESSSGPGLAIVRNIAQRQGASLTLGDSPLGGLQVMTCFD
jgi:signal transduction histidine kinase